MKVYVKSERGLRHLSTDIWSDIFVESVEGVDNIIKVNSISLNEDTCFPSKNTEGENAMEEIRTCITLESLEKEVYEVRLDLELEENFYDEADNLLHAELNVNEDEEIETKFYYEIGNFLKSEDKKKVYSTLFEAR